MGVWSLSLGGNWKMSFNEMLLERSYDLRLYVYVNTNAFTLDMSLSPQH